MTIIGNGKHFQKVRFSSEAEFEDDIVISSNILFGDKIVFINPKKKIESKSLGGVIPDGFFFDFHDPADPQFYIVEVELISHSFFNHVFPQITKFFAFFKNTNVQKSLVDHLFSIIEKDQELKLLFKKFLGKTEVYKFLTDIIESSQNILLIANGVFKEFQEITDTYTDTWGKLVKYIEICKYISGDEYIYTIIPDFDTIQYVETIINVEEPSVGGIVYSEEFHLEGVSEKTRKIYEKIKEMAYLKDSSLYYNPQKYYISIKDSKNIVYLKIRKNKIRAIIMLPEEVIRSLVHYYSVSSLSQGVQDFYNGPCAAVDITDLTHFDEIKMVFDYLIEFHRKE